MPLPKEFVSRNLEKAKGMSMFGVSIEVLTRDELIACVVAGFDAEKRARSEGQRRLDAVIGMRA